MSIVLRGVVLGLATVSTGLIAGLFYAFVWSVLPALRGTADRTSIEVMQRVNAAIQNAWFGLTLVASVLATAAAAALNLAADRRAVLVPVAAALFCHLAAAGITGRVNVPLNNRLDAAGPPGAIADPAAVRHAFDRPWARWNTVRAALTLGALVLLCAALVQYGRIDAA